MTIVRAVVRPSLVVILSGIAVMMLGAGVAHAEGEGFVGTITDADEEPIAEVELVATDADGNEVGRATTDDAGEWTIELPGPGTYDVELLTDTLPEGVELRNPDRNPVSVQVRSGAERRLLFPIGEGAVGASGFGRIANRAVTGLKFGLIIAITSVGLSLVFGTTGLINFAHGELVTFGAIVAWFLNDAGLHITVAAPLAVLAGAGFGWALERGMFARLRDRRVRGFQFLVITIGLALFAQHVLRIWFGPGFRPYKQYVRQAEMDLGPISIGPRDLTVMVLCIVVLVAVATMLQTTRTGKAMRAVSDNPDLAEASGIAVPRVILLVWVMAGALAAIGGVFLGLVSTVQYLMGFQLLLLMFAAIILGGLGTAYGAMAGGLVVGLVSEVSTLWLPTELKNVWALLILILVLLVRPQGILGRPERFG